MKKIYDTPKIALTELESKNIILMSIEEGFFGEEEPLSAEDASKMVAV